jgi:hypothetical protein
LPQQLLHCYFSLPGSLNDKLCQQFLCWVAFVSFPMWK